MTHPDAGVAQLVEHNLAKVGVTGSNPATRSIKEIEKEELLNMGNSSFFWRVTTCVSSDAVHFSHDCKKAIGKKICAIISLEYSGYLQT